MHSPHPSKNPSDHPTESPKQSETQLLIPFLSPLSPQSPSSTTASKLHAQQQNARRPSARLLFGLVIFTVINAAFAIMSLGTKGTGSFIDISFEVRPADIDELPRVLTEGTNNNSTQSTAKSKNENVSSPRVSQAHNNGGTSKLLGNRNGLPPTLLKHPLPPLPQIEILPTRGENQPHFTRGPQHTVHPEYFREVAAGDDDTDSSSTANSSGSSESSKMSGMKDPPPPRWEAHKHYGRSEPLFAPDDFEMMMAADRVIEYHIDDHCNHSPNSWRSENELASVSGPDGERSLRSPVSAGAGPFPTETDMCATIGFQTAQQSTKEGNQQSKDGGLLAAHKYRNVSLSPLDHSVVENVGLAPASATDASSKWRYDSFWTRPLPSQSSTHEDFVSDFRNTPVRFGILASALLVDTRLLPMLNTSLRDATMVDVFIKKTTVSHAVSAYIRRSVRTFHPHWRGIRVFELYTPDEKFVQTKMEHHNAWMNLEIIRIWRSEAERDEVAVHHRNDVRRPQWYGILDDDTYVFVDSLKAALSDIRRFLIKQRFPQAAKEMEVEDIMRRKLAASRGNGAKSLPLLPPDTDDYRTNYQLPPIIAGLWYFYVYARRIMKPLYPPTFNRVTTNFVFGGTGYFFNRDAMMPLNNSFIDYCRDHINLGAGDAIATICMQEALAGPVDQYKDGRQPAIEIMNMPHMVNKPLSECSTEKATCHAEAPFPVSVHRLVTTSPNGLSDAFAARAIYEMRKARGELVHWNDIKRNFAPSAGNR